MQYSTLFKIGTDGLSSEAEVETRLLPKLFSDLGHIDKHVIPKKRVSSLTTYSGSKKQKIEVDFLLQNSAGKARVIVEAKDPKKNIEDAFGQAASYALRSCKKLTNAKQA